MDRKIAQHMVPTSAPSPEPGRVNTNRASTQAPTNYTTPYIGVEAVDRVAGRANTLPPVPRNLASDISDAITAVSTRTSMTTPTTVAAVTPPRVRASVETSNAPQQVARTPPATGLTVTASEQGICDPLPVQVCATDTLQRSSQSEGSTGPSRDQKLLFLKLEALQSEHDALRELIGSVNSRIQVLGEEVKLSDQAT